MDKIDFIPKGQQSDFFVLFWQFSQYKISRIILIKILDISNKNIKILSYIFGSLDIL